MTPSNHSLPIGHSAKILVFPLRERTASRALPEQKFAAMEAIARNRAGFIDADSWYHDEAISQDSDKSN